MSCIAVILDLETLVLGRVAIAEQCGSSGAKPCSNTRLSAVMRRVRTLHVHTLVSGIIGHCQKWALTL